MLVKAYIDSWYVGMGIITKILWLTFAISLITEACSATNVSVTINNETFFVGDRVELTLEVNPTNSAGVGGQFILYERVNNTYQFVRRLLMRPSPSQCPACSGIPGSTPIREPYKGLFYFIPTKPGRYNAEANFEGVEDSKNFTVIEVKATTTTTTTTVGAPSSGASYGTTTTTTTKPQTMPLCSDGDISISTTSEDRYDTIPPKLEDKNLEHKVGGSYYTSSELTGDDIQTSGFGLKTFNVTFYVPADLGDEASIYVKAGTEDGLTGETNFTIDGRVVGSCNISDEGTGGVEGRWGECTAKLNPGLLKEGMENTFTVVNNILPNMFDLSFIDYDYMEFNCVSSTKSPRKTTTTTVGPSYGTTITTTTMPGTTTPSTKTTVTIPDITTPTTTTTTTPPETVTQTTVGAPSTGAPYGTTITTTTPTGGSKIINNALYAIIGVICLIAFISLVKSLR